MSLRAAVLTELSAVEKLRPAWLELLERSDTDSVMLTPMWLIPWWRVFGTADRQLRILVLYDGSRLVGLATLLRRRCWHRGIAPIRRIEPLGTGERQGEQVCSEYMNFVAERGHEQAVASQLVEALADGALGAWDEFVLPAMNAESPQAGMLAKACRRGGMSAALRPVAGASYIALPSTWDEYLGRQTADRRYYVTSSIRNLENWAGADLCWHSAQSDDQLREGLAILHHLHAERWQANGQSGVFAATRFAQFHEAAAREMLHADALELDWLSVRGEPIAVQYSFRWLGKISTYQSGRKMDVPKKVRAGVALHALLIRRAIERGCREYDLLGGVARYKQDLAECIRPMVDFRATRPGVWTAIQQGVELGVAALKRMRRLVTRSRFSQARDAVCSTAAGSPQRAKPVEAIQGRADR